MAKVARASLDFDELSRVAALARALRCRSSAYFIQYSSLLRLDPEPNPRRAAARDFCHGLPRLDRNRRRPAPPAGPSPRHAADRSRFQSPGQPPAAQSGASAGETRRQTESHIDLRAALENSFAITPV